MRKVLRGGVLGAVPGLLIALVPLILYEMDVLTSDQSQIGFIGIPVMFLGILVGVVVGASNTAYGGKVTLGMIAGLVAGIAAGIGIDAALQAAGATIAGIWFFLAPVGAIAGAVIGAWRGEQGGPPKRPASQHRDRRVPRSPVNR